MLLLALMLGHPAPSLSAGSEIFGVPLAALPDGGGVDEVGGPAAIQPEAGDSLRVDSNAYAGGGVDLTLGRSAGLVLAGGVVELRDPVTTAESIRLVDHYWATSVGLEIRF